MPTMLTGRGASRTSRPTRAAAATCLLLLLACPHLAAGLPPFSSATDLLVAMRGAYTSIRDMLPLLAQDLIDNLGTALNTTLTDYLGSIVGQDNTTTSVASLAARKLQAFSLLALPSTRTLVAHGALYRQDCPADDLRGPVVADKALVGGFLRDSVFAAMAYVPDRLPAPGTGIQNVTLGSARIQPPITTYVETVEIYTVESVNSQPFYIALDHNYQRILLVIRGSAANNDWWTNIVDSTPVNISYTHPDTGARTNAWVHKGFKGNAEGVFGLARGNLTKVVAQYPTYKLHVIGHSLGGAICSHITFMLAVGEFNITGLTPDRVNSTCFSVPRTYDWNTARLAARYVRTVYKGADVVVRVTPDAARAALSRAAVVRDLIPTTCQLSVTQLAQAVGLLGSGLTGSSTDCTQDPTAPGCAGIVAGLASCMNFDLAQAPICLPATNLTAVFGNLSAFLNMDPTLPDVINSTVLFCPGTLYQLAEGGMLSAASPEDFPDIVTWKNGTGLNDHFMGDSVVPALNGVYQSLGGSALVDPMPSANGTMPASPSAPGGTAPPAGAPAPSPSPHNHAGPLTGAASSLLLAMVSVLAMWLARW